MATETPTRTDRWLSADELRKLAAVEPEAGPAPTPVHRTDEAPSRLPFALGVAAVVVAVLCMILLAL